MTTTSAAAQAQSLISASPRACYRTLELRLHRAGIDLSVALPLLSAARPHCGYDCDERCPVSGRAED